MWPSIVHYHQSCRTLDDGGLISYPTESVFGVGCDPHQLDAVDRLLTLKRRSWTKGLILIASEPEQLEDWVDWSSVPNLSTILESWPGPETWVVPVAEHVSPFLRGQFNSLAVRVSAHPVVRGICDHFGSAIISTSANHAGQREARTSFAVRQLFKDKIDYYVPGHTINRNDKNSRPSRIRMAATGQVLRA